MPPAGGVQGRLALCRSDGVHRLLLGPTTMKSGQNPVFGSPQPGQSLGGAGGLWVAARGGEQSGSILPVPGSAPLCLDLIPRTHLHPLIQPKGSPASCSGSSAGLAHDPPPPLSWLSAPAGGSSDPSASEYFTLFFLFLPSSPPALT